MGVRARHASSARRRARNLRKSIFPGVFIGAADENVPEVEGGREDFLGLSQ